ncbi:hypothetical protein RJT34_09876 [Clitoria ternatea]|uniref:Uncharacterized protein n=1 Tax=Clitoria ternatea TaxID=43366 RepID=A0AAN9K9D1_CLITE
MFNKGHYGTAAGVALMYNNDCVCNNTHYRCWSHLHERCSCSSTIVSIVALTITVATNYMSGVPAAVPQCPLLSVSGHCGTAAGTSLMQMAAATIVCATIHTIGAAVIYMSVVPIMKAKTHAEEVWRKAAQYEHFNILPLYGNCITPSMMKLLEIQAVIDALHRVDKLPTVTDDDPIMPVEFMRLK